RVLPRWPCPFLRDPMSHVRSITALHRIPAQRPSYNLFSACPGNLPSLLSPPRKVNLQAYFFRLGLKPPFKSYGDLYQIQRVPIRFADLRNHIRIEAKFFFQLFANLRPFWHVPEFANLCHTRVLRVETPSVSLGQVHAAI